MTIYREVKGPATRCVCHDPAPVRQDDHFVICQKCSGYYAMLIDSFEALDELYRMRERNAASGSA